MEPHVGMLRTSLQVVVGRTETSKRWRTAPRKLLVAVAILTLYSMGVAVSKFTSTDVDDPQVEPLSIWDS